MLIAIYCNKFLYEGLRDVLIYGSKFNQSFHFYVHLVAHLVGSLLKFLTFLARST